MAKPRLYVAPASAGKTAFALKMAREAAQDSGREVRLCVSGRQQVISCQRRLALDGGALGVRVMTFEQLYRECLDAAGESYMQLHDAVQYRLIRSMVNSMALTFYGKVAQKPGFIQMVQAFIGELKGARIWPDEFLRAVADEPRLSELGLIYQAYQARLEEEEWADYAGMGWLAVERLEQKAQVAKAWPLLIVDGFDNFTEVQLDLLKVLAGRVGDMVITLTGGLEEQQGRRVFRRFQKTRKRLEQLETNPHLATEALPDQAYQPALTLAHLEQGLFEEAAGQIAATGHIELIQAPDRAGETREALRWLKERLVRDGLRPAEVALLARDLTPYRPFVSQTAAEFGLPVHLEEGLPLRDSPIIAAILDLMRLVLPAEEGEPTEVALPRKGVVAAWRSPFFDWENAYPSEAADEAIGITPADADALDALARWGRVIGGQAQWAQVLESLTGRESRESLDDEQALPANVVAGPEAQALQEKFGRFLWRIYPLQGPQRYREHIRWLEELIGGDPETGREAVDPRSLKVAERARQDDSPLGELEMAALNALKHILRGLLWVEDRVGGELVDFARFFAELSGAIEAATFDPPSHPGREGILATGVLRARGLPFKAVALMGLAEGAFPATLSEDVFLTEVDRDRLRNEAGFPLESTIESAEREFFYEAITAATERLLVTRPNLADSGAEWLPSPFWEELGRLLAVEPVPLKSDSIAPPQRAASQAELMESLVARPNYQPALAWVHEHDPDRWRQLMRAGRTFTYRFSWATTIFDGDLVELGEAFAGYFHPGYGWSPSSLESYLGCPYRFYVSKVLKLEPRMEPVEGLDARQLGSVYHEILEALYKSLPLGQRNDTQALLTALPGIAGPILDQAPGRQGFRETAWWLQTREEIQQHVTRSVLGLAAIDEQFVPIHFEARFFGEESLVVGDEQDSFRLHGVIDRVDRDPSGRLRVIDYKTAGPYSYGKQALEKGEKLQLPLYALAAQDALGLGTPADGFYWHIRHAEASGLKLADFGPEDAINLALEYAWKAVGGARQGHFEPTPPSGGCPDYCPAVAFCWRYRGGW